MESHRAHLRYTAKLRASKIKDKIPMRNSKWLKCLHPFFNLAKEDTQGELLRSTLLSGGTIHCSRSTYFDSLQVKAIDITSGVILTDNEIVHNSEGYNAYFEIDWADLLFIPSDEQIQKFLCFLQDILKECFPDAENHDIHVLQNFPYIKEKNDGNHYFAFGLHLICKGIKTKSETNLLVAGLVDCRISKSEPMWAGKIDLTSYHSSSANLRPAFAYKMSKCPTCDLRDALNKNKKQKVSKGKGKKRNEQSETCSVQILSCGECFNGKLIQSNYYSLKYILRNGSFEEVYDEQYSIEDVLKMTSIMLDHHHATQDFHVLHSPLDMGGLADLRPKKLLAANAPASFNRTKGALFGTSEHSSLYLFIGKLVNKMIAPINPEFAVVTPHKLMHRKVKSKNSNLLITLTGKGSRFCLLSKAEHSNGVYYILDRRGTLTFFCHKMECKSVLQPTKDTGMQKKRIEIKLNKEEQLECRKLSLFFGSSPLEGIQQSSKTWDVEEHIAINSQPKVNLLNIVSELKTQHCELEEW